MASYVDKQSKSLQKELKGVNSLLKLDYIYKLW